MSLLEGVVALVILGVSAVSYLDLFQAGAESLRRGREWERVTQQAEAAMEATLLGDALQAQSALVVEDSLPAPTVRIEPWRGGLSQIVVTATGPGGESFVLRRLVQR